MNQQDPTLKFFTTAYKVNLSKEFKEIFENLNNPYYTELMEKLFKKIPYKYSQLDQENTGGALSYYLYQLIRENCAKINKSYNKLRQIFPSVKLLKKNCWKLNLGVYFCLLLFHSLHRKYIKNKKETNNDKDNNKNNEEENNIYKKLNTKKEEKYLLYLLNPGKNEFLDAFKSYIINMPQFELCFDDFFSQLQNCVNDNAFIDNIKKIFKEKKEKKFLGLKREEKEKDNENIVNNNNIENNKIKKITDFFNVVTTQKNDNEISLEENEKEEDGYELNNKKNNEYKINYGVKKGFLLIPDKNFFQKRYKVMTLSKKRIRHKSKIKKKKKKEENINSNCINNHKSKSPIIQKDFKGIKSLIESKVINLDKKNQKNNKETNINNNHIINSKINPIIEKPSNIKPKISKEQKEESNIINKNNNEINNNTNHTYNYNNSYSNLYDKQLSYMTDLSFSRAISSGINSRLEKMPLIKTAKKGKKRDIGGKKVLKALEKNCNNKTKEKIIEGKINNKFIGNNKFSNVSNMNNIIDINHRIKSKSKFSAEQQKILKYIVNENFYGNENEIDNKKNDVNSGMNNSDVNTTNLTEEKNLIKNLKEDEILIPKTPERENEDNNENENNKIELEKYKNNLDTIDVKMNYNLLWRQKV